MKKIVLIALCALCLSAPLRETFAAEEPVVITTLFSDGSTNKWTQADLVAALQLVNRKYHRDVATAEGRRAWHGKRVGKQVITTNETGVICMTTTHEDGTTFVDAAKVITPADSAAAYLASLPKPAMTNGIPVRLANARLRAAQEKGVTNVVTLTISPAP